MTKLEKLDNLIVPKPMPKDVTLSLTRSFDDPRETVDTYWFTDTIREYFERILELAATGRGQGFWIEAEYGAGKTHFLATLACLLAHADDDALWDLVKDDDVRNFRRRLASQRLFPVVLSLKGQSSVDEWAGRTLLSVLERDGFSETLNRVGLRGQVQVTSTDELLNWFHNRDAGLRGAIERYVEKETGFAADEYVAGHGRRALVDVIRRYCDANEIQPRTSASVKERLLHLFNQLTSPNLAGKGVEPYTGLLVIIDEWEFWDRLHPTGTPDAAHDEEVLETLSFVLAQDLGLPVLTLVGSQSSVPRKLRGGQRGDRFINMPLLKGAGEGEYDVIVSYRVRKLISERMPEINQHYDYYAGQFEFAKTLDRQRFYDTFPFQPRCFDVVRRVTAREMPTARSGIYILHQTLNNEDALSRDALLIVSDLLDSQHLMESLNTTTAYKKATQAYRAALDALPSLDIDDDDRPLAEKVLKTLFLWYLAYLEVPRPMTLTDLVEATLASSGVLRSDDQIALVLDPMSILPQVDFAESNASFVPKGAEGEPFFVKFGRFERQITDRHEMHRAWQESLFFSTMETGGVQSLFGQYEPDKTKALKVIHRHIEYPGELVVAGRWRSEYGQALQQGEDKHFRVVILTQIDQQVGPAELHDSRIAVLMPGPLTPEVFDAAQEYLATQAMVDAYSAQVGKEAEAVRQELTTVKRPQAIRNLLDTQQRVYRAGSVITQHGLGISIAEVFGPQKNQLQVIVDKLLTNTYPHLPVAHDQMRRDLSANDVGKVFNGLFAPTPSKAEQSAANNFSVGLELARAENPRRYEPGNAVALKLIGQMLDESGGGELATWRIYDRLSKPPYGLPYALVSLYLLCFVRHNQDPVVNLHLKPNHRLRLRSGDLPPRDILSRGNVIQLGWKTGMDRWFDMLSPTPDIWPQVVPFGRVLRDDLTIGIGASEMEQQQSRLAGELASLRDGVGQTTRQLNLLCGVLGDSLAPQDQDAIAHIEAVSQADTYQDFFDRLGETYTQPDALGEDLDVFKRLSRLAADTAEIQSVKGYLGQIEAGALSADLDTERATLNGRIDLTALAAQPHLWPSIQSQFEQFRRRYRSDYQIHHRDTYKAIRQIRDDLSGVPRRIEALRLLNTVRDLGHLLGQDLDRRHAALENDLRVCDVGVNEVEVERSPVCQNCGLRLSRQAPDEDARRLRRELDDALGEQLRRLKTETIRKVLAESDTDRMEKLVKVIELSSLDSLVDVLDEELVAFLAETLEMQGVATVPTDLLQQLADKYPVLEENDIPAFVKELNVLLAQAFVTARTENPEKRTIQISLK